MFIQAEEMINDMEIWIYIKGTVNILHSKYVGTYKKYSFLFLIFLKWKAKVVTMYCGVCNVCKIQICNNNKKGKEGEIIVW